MSEYKNIIGKGVRFLSSNLDNDQAEGQIWYNSSDDAFKNLIVNEAWASSSPLVNAKQNQSGDGTQTAALSVGGNFPANMADFELYDGSGWSSQPNVPYSAQLAATCGTQTAAITFGGTNPPTPIVSTTIEYDGSSWTTGGSLNTGRVAIAGAGTQTATLACQGSVPNPSPPPSTIAGNDTEEYNGSSWTTVNDTVTTKRNSPAALGTQTAAVGAIGGGDPSEAPTSTSEEYDGTNWTASATINTSRLNLSGTGTNTAGLIHGGATGPGGGPTTGATEKWDGTSWSAAPSMATARNQKGSRAGSSSAALAFGGYDGSNPSSATEEFTRSLNVITAGAWANGNAALTARNNAGSAGTQTAGMIIAGSVNDTELYDGTSFTEGSNVNTSREQHFSTGTQAAAVIAGGSGGNQTEEWNGSSFSNVPGALVNYPRNAGGTAGTQTAAVAFGGNNPPGPVNAVSHTEEYNGTSFSEVNNMSTARFGMNSGMGGASQTAAIAIGGFTPPVTVAVEEYDGTNWTNGGSLLIAAQKPGLGGTQTAIMVAGNELPSVTAFCQVYDGTSFASAPSLGSVQSSGASAGTSTDMWFATGGNGTSNVTTNQEFTAETSALNIKTITTS